MLRICFSVFILLHLFQLRGQELKNVYGRVDNIDGEAVAAEICFSDSLENNFYSYTDSTGYFHTSIPPGYYHIKVDCGCARWETIEVEQDIIEETDLGMFTLSSAKTEGNIVGEKTDSTFIPERDEKASVLIVSKKIINQKDGKLIYDATQDITAQTGSVADVLQNIPAVTVDQDGNISLRGNSNVRILINGKQSALVGKGNENTNLQNIPANQIESIEVINNPSARYEAEGAAGVINIILKNQKNKGWNGNMTANAGYTTNTGLSFSGNYKTKDANVYGTFSGRYLEPQGKTSFDNKFYQDNHIQEKRETQNSNRLQEKLDLNFILGADYEIDSMQTFKISAIYGLSRQDNTRSIYYDDYNAIDLLTDQSNRNERELENQFSIEGNMAYDLKFKKKGHNLYISALSSYNQESENADIDEYVLFSENEALGLSDFTQTGNDAIQRTYVAQIDYILPIFKQGKIEAGGKYNQRDNDNNIFVQKQNLSSGDFVVFDNFTGTTSYQEDIYAAYMQYNYKGSIWNYAAGLRMEYSNISLSQSTIAQNSFQRNMYTDFFPNFFISYEIKRNHNISFNYSRRISRPFNRFLIPFFTFSDDRNTFLGNPNLKPTYIDKLQLSYNTKIKGVTCMPSLYFSYHKQPIQIYRNLEEFIDPISGNLLDVFVARPINISQRTQYGIEMINQFKLIKKWNFTTTINAFEYSQKGDFDNQNFDSKGFSWTGQLALKGSLLYGINLQINANYNGREQNGQFIRKGVFFMNVGLNKDIWGKAATISLDVNDLFNSNIRRVENYGDDYISNIALQFRQRQFNLSFVYRFKPEDNLRKSETKPMDIGGDIGL